MATGLKIIRPPILFMLKQGTKAPSGHIVRRWEYYRAQTRQFILKGSLTTTPTRAREIRRYADHLVSLAKGTEKSNPEFNKNCVAYFLDDASAVKKLYKEIVPLFKERSGNYTRIIRLPERTLTRDAKLSKSEMHVKFPTKKGDWRIDFNKPPEPFGDAVPQAQIEWVGGDAERKRIAFQTTIFQSRRDEIEAEINSLQDRLQEVNLEIEQYEQSKQLLDAAKAKEQPPSQ